MSIERPMFSPPGFLTVVAGTDVATSPETEPLPAQATRKRRRPYKSKGRKQVEYQGGLPVIDPAGEEDLFRHIAEHRAAVAHYDRCVTVEDEAEGKVSDDEYSHLQRNTRVAFDEMILFARCLILCRPTTRRGLIHQVRYLAAQFSEHVGWDEGPCQTIYLPEKIADRPWVAEFLRSLAAGLRKMGGELDAPKEGGRQ